VCLEVENLENFHKTFFSFCRFLKKHLGVELKIWWEGAPYS
jgi:hypothetical protein